MSPDRRPARGPTDWAVREPARAKLRVAVKRILRKHGYPPDFQQQATDTVLLQAERLCEGWVVIGEQNGPS